MSGGDRPFQPFDDDASLASRAAWLHYAGGLTQGEVATRLNIPAMKAHRLIARAGRDGLIRIFVDGAVAELRQLLDARPEFVIGHYFLGGALRDRGDYSDALQSVDRAITLAGDAGSPEMISARGQILARLGDLDGARAAIAEVANRATDERSTFALQAQVLTTLGERSAAIGSLERAAEQREAELIYLDARPVYRELRGSAAFEALRGAVGLRTY